MKKILVALLVISAIGATSCKKDAENVPAKSVEVNRVPSSQVAKTDVSSWD